MRLGIFGPIRVSSAFLPVRQAGNNEALIGHIAKIFVTPYDNSVRSEQPAETSNLITKAVAQPTNFQSIISLDRLCRTVHMLNYLNHSHNGGVIFLDVDLRHILGVQQEHGAYFEKIIFKCGLATKNIVTSTMINSSYALNHKELLDGLYNYRRHGYQIALNIGSLYAATGLWDLIVKLKANYLRINAPTYRSHSLFRCYLAIGPKKINRTPKFNQGTNDIATSQSRKTGEYCCFCGI